MRRLSVTLVPLLLGLSGPAAGAEFHFCWIGANGYTLDGEMRFPDALLDAPVITEADLTAFRITGYHDTTPIGAWSMADLTPSSTWHLRFWPGSREFPVGGAHLGPNGQAWNANGAVNDCGDPGFGFNSGTNAQDVCVNNQWITQSSINRFEPLRAFPGPLQNGCTKVEHLSAR